MIVLGDVVPPGHFGYGDRTACLKLEAVHRFERNHRVVKAKFFVLNHQPSFQVERVGYGDAFKPITCCLIIKSPNVEGCSRRESRTNTSQYVASSHVEPDIPRLDQKTREDKDLLL